MIKFIIPDPSLIYSQTAANGQGGSVSRIKRGKAQKKTGLPVGFSFMHAKKGQTFRFVPFYAAGSKHSKRSK